MVHLVFNYEKKDFEQVHVHKVAVRPRDVAQKRQRNTEYVKFLTALEKSRRGNRA